MITALGDALSPTDAPAESLVASIGAMLGLPSAIHTDVDLIERLEQGLPVAAVQALRTRAGLTDAEVFELIGPRRTLNRREETGQALSREEADKAVRIARVVSRARQTFAGDAQFAIEWLRQPLSALANRTPMQALTTESGALAVEEILIGVEYGMFG